MKTKWTYAAMVTLLFLMGTVTAWSQATSGKVQGRVTDGGKPVANADVVLTNLDNARTYKMKTDKNGQFSGVGIAFGDYEEEVISSSGDKLYKAKFHVQGEGGKIDDLSVEISSGKPGAGGPSKEEIEKIKASNAKAQGINALIKQYQDALNAKSESDKAYQAASANLRGKQDPASVEELKKLTDKHNAEVDQAWNNALVPLKQMVADDPARWEYQQALGNMQFNLGNYEDALATYEKGIPLAADAPKTDPKADPAKTKAAAAQMLTNKGNAYLKLKKNDKAIEAYTKAAEMDPNPATAYFNLCATQYNSGNTQGALAACDKAIAADPKRADAYFIKGSLMMADSKMDKDGKLQAPPGAAEALNKYLELAPDGGHANDVKQMLNYIGAKIETTYKEKKKK